jgi:hypothetical protein
VDCGVLADPAHPAIEAPSDGVDGVGVDLDDVDVGGAVIARTLYVHPAAQADDEHLLPEPEVGLPPDGVFACPDEHRRPRRQPFALAVPFRQTRSRRRVLHVEQKRVRHGAVRDAVVSIDLDAPHGVPPVVDARLADAVSSRLVPYELELAMGLRLGCRRVEGGSGKASHDDEPQGRREGRRETAFPLASPREEQRSEPPEAGQDRDHSLSAEPAEKHEGRQSSERRTNQIGRVGRPDGRGL